MLIGWQGRIFVGVGSDHTDRKVESYGVTVSKQMCDKPIASVLWELEDVIGHWDQMILRSHALIDGERVLYQEGTLDGMLPVKDLIARGFGDKELPDGCAMFGGTFAAKGGIRPASRFEFVLEDPVLKRSISHGYDVIALPVLGWTLFFAMHCEERWPGRNPNFVCAAAWVRFASLAKTGDNPGIGWCKACRFARMRT